MIDNIHTVKPHADIIVLGDFNIDLLFLGLYYYTAELNPTCEITY